MKSFYDKQLTEYLLNEHFPRNLENKIRYLSTTVFVSKRSYENDSEKNAADAEKALNQESTRQCLNNFQPPHASASDAKIQSSLTRGKVSQSNRHFTLFRE